MVTILIVLAILVLLGVIPAWPHSRGWGYGPSGGLGVIVLILLILVLTGRAGRRSPLAKIRTFRYTCVDIPPSRTTPVRSLVSQRALSSPGVDAAKIDRP